MQIYILVAVLALFGAGGWFAVEQYNSALEEKAAAEAQARNNADVANQWKDKADATQKDLDEANKLNTESQQRIVALQQQVDGFRAKRKALDAASPVAKAWGDSPVPDDVRRLRRADLGCATATLDVQCPSGAISPNPGAAAKRPN